MLGFLLLRLAASYLNVQFTFWLTVLWPVALSSRTPSRAWHLFLEIRRRQWETIYCITSLVTMFPFFLIFIATMKTWITFCKRFNIHLPWKYCQNARVSRTLPALCVFSSTFRFAVVSKWQITWSGCRTIHRLIPLTMIKSPKWTKVMNVVHVNHKSGSSAKIFEHSFIVVKNGENLYTTLQTGFANEERTGLNMLIGGWPIWPVIR